MLRTWDRDIKRKGLSISPDSKPGSSSTELQVVLLLETTGKLSPIDVLQFFI